MPPGGGPPLSVRAVALLMAAACLHPARAMPSFRFRIPNGEGVPCPPGVDGCEDEACPGVGHATCKGGTFPLNPFGAAFMGAANTCTQDLCKADSDGDGLTNGQELGDPCCEYVEGEVFEPNLPENYARSHPGFATSTGNAAEHLDAIKCEGRKATDAKPFDLDSWNPFNDGEEGFTKEFRIDKYQIPAGRTTYVDFAWSFPECADGDCYLVGLVALVDQSRFLHHYVLRGCAKDKGVQDGKASVGPIGAGMACEQSYLGGWAPGRNPFFNAHNFTARPMGKVSALSVQVHYDNPNGIEGVVDNSGLKVFYVKKPREHSLGELSPIRLSLDVTTKIPPNRPRHFLTTGCTVTGLTDEVTLYQVGWHAHLIGTEMYLDMWKGGFDASKHGEPILSDPRWWFDDQYFATLKHRNIKIKNGDYIVNTCVYNSTSRTADTRIGLETIDEMCWSQITYYPAQPGAKCREGYYTGDLEIGEDAHQIAVNHPSTGGGGPADELIGIGVDFGSPGGTPSQGVVTFPYESSVCDPDFVRKMGKGSTNPLIVGTEVAVRCPAGDLLAARCVEALEGLMGCRCSHHEGVDGLTEKEFEEITTLLNHPLVKTRFPSIITALACTPPATTTTTSSTAPPATTTTTSSTADADARASTAFATTTVQDATSAAASLTVAAMLLVAAAHMG